ncbi:2-amino-4-hydroxy-6-hydroxymethyldihydropteridine pyrophosphokinase [Acetobacter pasteurianus NBRC 101655]|uniref:2-amino-4-hydroxy-6-hydroxymethyldihydropteridine pyrophosphokinase n=1 Tax=Acetobacter pasteurianus NBRC 3188 TaxID=1226663 RepID=A0A401WR86_ACEPA|nr:2-amino-4-hydroxy-6-hydroxymethyldihydropteridine diphosphokinase [Acetobacter pasteurianus]BAU37673.1 2-amino-4-hydroxy-6-hydroxymethyldihydropteridine pyrophosphokinase [Acetobacter pasteurianus NBRC 101655]GCD51841.1 2-amino-4-hydroxy-6-hydroxymethyldihydropteridine pyrophosphokinase [Acetobacter pasteurianus NBRC 3188]CCT60189.1 2-amino-4-hydroxy-6-hydroxymethyldihydropteridinepyrophosphokinase HppK [Acetobacter pasteurianus 386B]
MSEMNTRLVLIAIGANLPHLRLSARQTCEQAVQALKNLPQLEVEAVSRWYESAPVPPSGQPPYVNGVVRCRTTLEPLALLDALQGVETRLGRVRSVPNAARTLDLDIISIDNIQLNTERLILPHPRATQRAFVLCPLHDVAPEWKDPTTGKGLDTLLKGVAGQEIQPAKE